MTARAEFTAMASTVTVHLSSPRGNDAVDSVRSMFATVEDVFREVERECTRFDPASPLMQANAAGTAWHVVGDICRAAIGAAYDAYHLTGGLFDPRILRSLESIGYDRSFAFDAAPTTTAPVAQDLSLSATHHRAWRPEFDAGSTAVRIGPDPIDLGGIGKGLALRWAANRLREQCPTFLIEAGGDCVLAGAGPEGDGWSVAVEDPSVGVEDPGVGVEDPSVGVEDPSVGVGRNADPVAVLRIVDQSCATTSIRVRHWKAGTRTVHHVIDPRTGAPSDAGLAAVTVVGPDPALAEVWSKTLFLQGRAGVRSAAAAAGLAALWIGSDGTCGWTDEMAPLIVWRAAA